MLFRSVLPALGGRSLSLPAELAMERVAEFADEVALLRRSSLERALCSRVLMLLMASSRAENATIEECEQSSGTGEKLLDGSACAPRRAIYRRLQRLFDGDPGRS
jgi:hypothetical protein